MTAVLVVNAGSSSLKLSVLSASNGVTAERTVDPWDGSPDHPEVTAFLRAQAGTGAVGHRVVHGGSQFTEATVIGDAVITAIAKLADLAPLHQPRAVAGIRAARDALPGLPHIACFDTAFHAGMPAAAATYALPAAWNERFGLRRYGFHGLSHQYASARCAHLLGRDGRTLRVVTCHLGAGESVAAVRGGASVDTSMGFTPLEGLVMATRSGSVDPGMLVWLLQHGLHLDELSGGLEKSAGLAGLAGLPGGSGDMREVRAASDAGSAAARLAIDVHTHRLRREIAAMAAAMDGLDALVFTGGIGEHQARVRAEATDGLSFLGVAVDPERNDRATSGKSENDADISADSAPVRTLVITAREDVEIARQVRAALGTGT